MYNVLFCSFLGERDCISHYCIAKELGNEYSLMFHKEFLVTEDLIDNFIADYSYRVKDFLITKEISLVIVTSIQNKLADVILAVAKELQLPTVYLVSEPLIEGLFFKHVKPDYIICWSLYQKNRFLTFGFGNEDKVFVTGYPLFDRFKLRKENKNIISKDQLNRKIKNTQKRSVVNIKVDTTDLTDLLQLSNLVSDLTKDGYFVYIQHPRAVELGSAKNTYLDLNRDGGEQEVSYFDSISYADFVVTDDLLHLLCGVVLSKQCLLWDKSSKFNRFVTYSSITSLEQLGYADMKHSMSCVAPLTTEQLNYFLLNYFPCTFDGNSGKRVSLILDFILTFVRNRKSELATFKELNLEMFDPIAGLRRAILQVQG